MTDIEGATDTGAKPAARAARPRRRRRRRVLAGTAAALAALGGYSAWANLRPFSLEATIEIDATPERVWGVLADLSAYHEWNPFIVASSGRVEVGATLTNRMRDASGERTFTPTVLEATPGRELRWLGKLGPGGLFNGEHRFVIEQIGPGRVRLTQREDFTGVLVPLLQRQLRTKTLPQFHAMNAALATRATTP